MRETEPTIPAINRLLREARARIGSRVTPEQLEEALAAGALLVDIRPVEQRERDGDLPGAVVIDRNVLEWRLDPTSPDRIAEIDGIHGADRPIVLVCNEGYSSSLAADTLRQLGLRNVVDLDGGYQAWLRRGVDASEAEPRMASAPRKKVAVVSCMDARLDPARILRLRDGDAHVIRNAGGVITDDAIRSLIISQRLLGTEQIVLLKHTDCGMLRFTDDQMKAEIVQDVGIRPPFSLEAFSDLDAEVRQSMARIQASPFILRKDSIRGYVYEVESGRLREVTLVP